MGNRQNPEKIFFEVGQLHLGMGTHFWAAEIYISACKPKRAILRKRSWPTSKKIFFLKICNFVSNIHFESREAIKTRWATAFWNLTVTKCRFSTPNCRQLLALHDIYARARLVPNQNPVKSRLGTKKRLKSSNFKIDL